MPKPLSEFMLYILELMDPIGPVQAVSMFGGYALKMDGVPFALVFDDELYLKTDAHTQGDFEAIGSRPFVYEKKGKMITLSNWLLPADIMEDPDHFKIWIEKAIAVGRKKALNTRT